MSIDERMRETAKIITEIQDERDDLETQVGELKLQLSNERNAYRGLKTLFDSVVAQRNALKDKPPATQPTPTEETR